MPLKKRTLTVKTFKSSQSPENKTRNRHSALTGRTKKSVITTTESKKVFKQKNNKMERQLNSQGVRCLFLTNKTIAQDTLKVRVHRNNMKKEKAL